MSAHAEHLQSPKVTDDTSRPMILIDPAAPPGIANQIEYYETVIQERPLPLETVFDEDTHTEPTPRQLMWQDLLSMEYARNYDFDGETEAAIASDGIIRRINELRRNKPNETRAQELALELRKRRLSIFISRVRVSQGLVEIAEEETEL